MLPVFFCYAAKLAWRYLLEVRRAARKGYVPHVRSKFSAMFRRIMRRTRAVWKDARWQSFLVVRFFRKIRPSQRKHPYNLTEWLTTIERRGTAKQGQSRWRGKSSQRLFCVLLKLSIPPLSVWIKDRKYNFERKVMSNQITIRPP